MEGAEKGVKEKWRVQNRGTKNSGGSRIGGPRIAKEAGKGGPKIVE